MEIKDIFIHHSGGIASNPYVSSAHLSFEDINKAHKNRWDFKSSLGFYSGYNILINKKGEWEQHRAIGEETAHTIGHNNSSIGICLIGNFSPGVDKPTPEQIKTLRLLLISLVEGRYSLFKCSPDVRLSLSGSRIYPHRHAGLTECYGRALSDGWARQIVIDFYAEKLRIMKQLVELTFKLKEALTKTQPRLGMSADDRDCDGFINSLIL